MADSTSISSTYMGSDYSGYLNDVRVRKTQLGKDDFLNLLAAQMQYQDPLEPQSNTDFIAQMAQFSSLEQMQAMSDAMIGMQSFNMVGKLVYAPNVQCDDGLSRDIRGYVETVIQQNGQYYAKIGDYAVPVSQITQIFDENSVLRDNPLLSSANLIGSTVKAYEADDNGNIINDDAGQPLTVSGVVTGIGVVDNAVVAFIRMADGTEYSVPVSNIFDIRQSAATQDSQPSTAPVTGSGTDEEGVDSGSGTVDDTTDLEV